MTILFICGSLEPGRDGVGDYTRRLAGELIRQGQIATIIALNDRSILDVYEGVQESEGIYINVLRIPAVLKTKERFNLAGEFIARIDPEWLSLQFVPFSFQKKGLPFGLGRRLAKIGKDRKWHVMFHELWVGMDVDASLKFKLWGKLQGILIENLIKSLNNSLLTTQTELYRWQLFKLGYNSKYLPLFGNIPCISNKTDNYLTNYLKFVVFGNIYSGSSVKRFVKEITEYFIEKNIIIEFCFIGRCGAEQSVWAKELEEFGVKIKIMGEQSENIVSETLSTSDFGISTTPALLLEKSGSVAAMLEHGLPVICVSKDWKVRGYNARKNLLFFIWGQDDFSTLLLLKKNEPYKYNLEFIVRNLLNYMN
ncbi:MAG: glycosyltransferase [Paludibacter sp.]|nr:glycosyltransferase [Paludibacter sp.]